MIEKALASLRRRIMKLVSRAVIKVVDDSLKAQGLQVELYADEVREDVERFQEYGFTSVPFDGCEAIFLSVGGSRDHGVVIATESREYRPKNLEEGDSALWTRNNGVMVYCKDSDGIVHIGGGTSAAEFVALSQKVDAEISRIWNLFSGWITVPNDGGAALKAAAALASSGVQSTAATKAKAT